MSHDRRVSVVDLAHFLHLDVGGSLLFIRGGVLSYYKRGRFREIGPVVPVEVLTQCAQYAHTLRGALLYIGDNGDGYTTEPDVYNCVNEAYRKLETKLRICGESHFPHFRSMGGARGDIDTPERPQFENWLIFEDLRQISAKTPTTPLSIPPHVLPGDIQRRKCVSRWTSRCKIPLYRGTSSADTWNICRLIRNTPPKYSPAM